MSLRSAVIQPVARYLFSTRARNILKFELARLRIRVFGPRRQQAPAIPRMHLGSGSRKLEGWLNVDMLGADVNIDMTARPFPFPDNSFECVVTQHLIEHLDLEDEVIPVFSEVFRVLNPSGELWLSTPDLEKLCAAYLRDGGQELYGYVETIDPHSLRPDLPESFAFNVYCFQRGMHKNIFDFQQLEWALRQCGFTGIRRVQEADLLRRFPGFPARHDDYETLSVCCIKS